MTKYQKELFSERLDEVAKTCKKMIENKEVPEGWNDAIVDLEFRVREVANKWRQVK